MASNLADQARRASIRAPGKVYYPQALVAITGTMETMRPLEGFETHARYGGAARRIADTIMVAARPTAVRVVRNSYQKPDSYHVEFDARALPLTPKQLRACAVEVYVWNAPYLGAPVPRDANGSPTLRPVIVGLVDDVTSRMDDGGHVVTLDGQDYTALFSEKEWSTKKSPQRRSPAGLRLDLQLEQMLREGDTGGVMRLRVEPESLRDDLPIVGAAYRRTSKKGKPVAEKSSWWDVMYRMAQQEGWILFVDGLDVVLTQPHVLHQHRAGLLPKSRPERPIYRFAWGRNLESLEMQRHLGKERTPVIEVRSYDDRTRQTITGRYPLRGESAATGVGTEREQVQVYQMPGISSETTLRKIARTVYELIAKSEQTVAMGTSDLVDLGGADVLEMRAGDAALLDVDVYNDEELARLPEGTRRARLEAAGFPESVAQYVARNYDVVDTLRGPWRVKEVTIDYSTEGVSVEAELQEYVQVPTE
jgi:hypothetical protein